MLTCRVYAGLSSWPLWWLGLVTLWAGILLWSFLRCHILRGLAGGTARLAMSGLQSNVDKKLGGHSYIFYFDFAIMLP